MERLSEEWQTRAKHMPAFCTKVLAYTDGLEQDKFVTNQIVYDAILHNLALIGEAANRIPRSIQNMYSEILWKGIIGTRHRIIHGYPDIDNDLVWDTVQNKVPALVTALQNLLEAEGDPDAQQ